MEELRKISLICENCGGTLQVDEGKEIIACPYCGNKTLIVESDAVTMERIRTTAQKEVEMEKIRVADLEHRRILEKEERQELEQQAAEFRKGKWSKVLIVLFVIAGFLTYGYFADGSIIAGILSLTQTFCFGVSWAMGMQFIREKRKSIHILIGVLGILLMVPINTADTAATKKANEAKEVKWSIIFMGDLIPEPDSKRLDIHTNTSDELWMDVDRTTQEDYYEYIAACKEAGYTVDVKENSYGYEAYNEEGYHLRLKYYDYNEEMTVNLDAPGKNTASDDVSAEGTAPSEPDRSIVEATQTPEPESKHEEVTESSEPDIEKEDTPTQVEPEVTEAPATIEIPDVEDVIDPQFKETMDEFEAFFDEYIELMEKMENADSMESLTLLGEYTEYLEQYTIVMEKMSALESEDMNAAEALYYAEVTARIYKKLEMWD